MTLPTKNLNPKLPNFCNRKFKSSCIFRGFEQLSSSIGWRVMAEYVGPILRKNFGVRGLNVIFIQCKFLRGWNLKHLKKDNDNHANRAASNTAWEVHNNTDERSVQILWTPDIRVCSLTAYLRRQDVYSTLHPNLDLHACFVTTVVKQIIHFIFIASWCLL